MRISRGRVVSNTMGFKFFHDNLNVRRHRKAGAKFKKMVTPSTQSTHFMQPFISDRNFEKSFRSRDRQSTGKRLSNIDVHTHPSKATLLPQKGIMINSNHIPNGLKKLNKSVFSPKLPRQTRDTNPLINSFNRGRIRIKVRHPRTQHKIQAFNKPGPIKPDKLLVSHSSKP